MPAGKYIRTEEYRANLRQKMTGRKRGPFSEEHRARMSAASKGKSKGPMKEETRRKIAESLKGRVFSPEHAAKLQAAKIGRTRAPFSEEWKYNLGNAQRGRSRPDFSPEWCTKISQSRKQNGVAKGDRNPNWRGGITPIGVALRNSDEYKAWRKAVYQRDGYCCVKCKIPGNGHNLNAHHKIPFSLLLRQGKMELLWDVTNGVTLCEDCHKETDSYGWKSWNNFLRKLQ
jgi:hypothetical protein